MNKNQEFIQEYLIERLYKVIYCAEQHYFAFSLMSQAIEYLGYWLDEGDLGMKLFDTGRSQRRFNTAISQFFPERYHQFIKNTTGAAKKQNYKADATLIDLYAELRCGLCHILVPGSRVILDQRSTNRSSDDHLGIFIYNGVNWTRSTHLGEATESQTVRSALMLICEDFYNDFTLACQKCIIRIQEILDQDNHKCKSKLNDSGLQVW